MLRIVPHTVPRVGNSCEHADGFDLHLLNWLRCRYLPRVPDVSKLVSTRPWIESLKDKSIVEIELAAALVPTPTPLTRNPKPGTRNDTRIVEIKFAAALFLSYSFDER